MTVSNICILGTIAVYLVGMLIIGFRCARKNESSADFYLGGRKLGPLVTAMSAEASDMSSYLLMGLPGLAYLSGVADVGWTAIGLAVGTYLNWLFTALRLRRYTQETGSFTIPQFFSRRFRDDKNILAVLAAVIIIIFFIPYTASGFAACGKLFSSLFGMNYMTAMIISAVVIVAYTTAGGFFAASATDFVQSIIMTVAIVFVLVFSTISAGGIDVVVENAKALPGYLSLTASYIEDTGKSEPYNLLHIITTLSWGLGYFGMPHILLRFMAIEDEKKLKLSRRVASVWVVIAMAMAVLIGIVGRALSNTGLVDQLHGNDTETIIVRVAHLLSTSQLLAAASSVSENILREAFHLKISEKKSMLAARLTVIGIAILGIIIARNPDSSVFGIVSFAWAGFGAAFGPLVICSLFWKRTTLPGAIAGMVSGGAMVFIWKYLIKPIGGVFGIYELLPAFLVGLVLMVIVSLCTKAPSKEITDEFDRVKAMGKAK